MPQQPTSPPGSVGYPSIVYREEALKWPRLLALLGGTEAMRAMGETYLPRHSQEEKKSYDTRRAQSFLYNAYGDTIKRLTAKPFSRPVTMANEPKDERIGAIKDNVDLTGKSITQLGRQLFKTGTTFGLYHLLVDLPALRDGASLAEERASLRPLLFEVEPVDLIGWKIGLDDSGKEVLREVRIREARIEDKPGSEWEDEYAYYVRVITLDRWSLYRWSDESKGWAIAIDSATGEPKEGRHSFGEVPLITGYFNQTGFMRADPPLNELADLNLCHWQSFSEQRRALSFARFGVLFGSGLTDKEIKRIQSIGPNTIIGSENPNAKLMHVEHTGQGIGAGEVDIEKLERRMEVLGLQPMLNQTGEVTATARAIDAAAVNTDIQSWVRVVEDTLNRAYKKAGNLVGMDEAAFDESFSVQVYNDFPIGLRGTEEVTMLMNLYVSGRMPPRLFWTEMKRRGVINEDESIDEIVAWNEASGMGMEFSIEQPTQPGTPPPRQVAGEPPVSNPPGKGAVVAA